VGGLVDAATPSPGIAAVKTAAAAAALASIFSIFSPARRDGRDGAAAYRNGKLDDSARRFGAAARRDPKDPAWALDLGTALGAAGKRDDARAPLAGAARGGDRAVAADALYQQGTLDLGGGDYRSAVDRLRESLLLDPSRGDAKRNYELARRKLQERRPPPAPSASPPPSGSKKSPSPASPPPRNDSEFERKAGMTRQEADALLRSLDAEQRQKEKTSPTVGGRDW
jgi:tetratricopeptide (TPR) repeat protein